MTTEIQILPADVEIEIVEDGVTLEVAAGLGTATVDAAIAVHDADVDAHPAMTIDASQLTSGTVPSARIGSASVTQHQAAITITESQISNLFATIAPLASPTFTGTVTTAALNVSASAFTLAGTTSNITLGAAGTAIDFDRAGDVYIQATNASGDLILRAGGSTAAADVLTLTQNQHAAIANGLGVGGDIEVGGVFKPDADSAAGAITLATADGTPLYELDTVNESLYYVGKGSGTGFIAGKNAAIGITGIVGSSIFIGDQVVGNATLRDGVGDPFAVALGYRAWYDATGVTVPLYSTVVGIQAAAAATASGSYTTIFGSYTGYQATLGNSVVAYGARALYQATQSDSTAVVGYQAGFQSALNQVTLFGTNSGANATMTGTSAQGYYAAYQSTALYGSYFGNNAGRVSSGNYSIGVGYNSLYTSTGIYAIGIGFDALRDSSGSYTIALGSNAGDGSTAADALYLGSDRGISNATDDVLEIGNRNGVVISGVMGGAAADNEIALVADVITVGQKIQVDDDAVDGLQIAASDGTPLWEFDTINGKLLFSALGSTGGVVLGDVDAGIANVLNSVVIGDSIAGGVGQLWDNLTDPLGVFIGGGAVNATKIGRYSTIIGYQAGKSMGDSSAANSYHVILGANAGHSCTSSASFVAIGARSMMTATNATQATAGGYEALYANSGTGATAWGYRAGRNNSGDNCAFVGSDAGNDNAADGACAFGRLALEDNTGINAVGLGRQAGDGNAADRLIGIGHESGMGATVDATDLIAIGYRAGKNSSGDNCLFLGRGLGENNTTDDVIQIGNLNRALIEGIASTTAAASEVTLNADIIKVGNLPTSDPLVDGQLWDDSGTIKISSG